MDKKFIGVRLRDARAARSLTAVALAEKVGVKPASISHYERRGVTPRPDVLGKLAEVLELPQAYFFRALPPEETSVCRYRSLSAATKRARSRAEVYLRWLQGIVRYVSTHVEFPAVDLPDFGTTSPEALSMDDIEQIATRTRRYWAFGDGPISNLLELLELKGVIVSRFPLHADKLDAFSQRSSLAPFVILNADKDNSVRSRFDCAHELGHLVMHHRCPLGDSATYKLMEQQAHRFAAAFLFPAEAFRDEVFSLNLGALFQLKPRWKVSAQLMIRRAHDLKLVTKSQYERAFWRLSRAGYRTSEKWDDTWRPEQPSLLADAIRLIINQGGHTRGDLLYVLPLSPTDIEMLAGLPDGFMQSDDWGRVYDLKPRTTRRQRLPDSQHGGDVVDLSAYRNRPTAVLQNVPATQPVVPAGNDGDD